MTRAMLLRGGLVADGISATTRLADILIEGPVIVSVAAPGGSGAPAAPGAPAAGAPGAGAAGGPAVGERGSGGPPAGERGSGGPAAGERGSGGQAADCEVIDLAPGSVICPGFIDAHVHAEGPLLAAGRVDGALAQGVTTLVVGQDGQSWVGASAATARYLNQYFGPVNGTLEPVRELSVAGYRDALSGRLAQNVAVLASQGTIRHNVAGMTPGSLGRRERAAARREVEDALADGAVGLSSGLDYLPSRFGAIAEVADFARPLADAGRPYVSHLRAYGSQVKAGLEELVAVGRRAGVRVHASHLWGAPAGIEAAFRQADAAAVSVSYDMYPYRRSSTVLAVLLLPAELQGRGPQHTLSALTSPRQRSVLLAGEKFTDGYLQNLYLGCLPPQDAQLAGLSIAQAAAASSQPPGEWALDLLVRTRLGVGAHLDRPELTEQSLAWLAAGDRHSAGSDGIYQGQHPHPRGYAAFAALAGHYLARGADTGYQQLARHLSARAADVYGLRDRGRLAPGMAADVCVIGPAGITARASYGSPAAQATGVDLVIVNGVITWRDGQPVTTQFPGQLVS